MADHDERPPKAPKGPKHVDPEAAKHPDRAIGRFGDDEQSDAGGDSDTGSDD